jgi:hypothetical protein
VWWRRWQGGGELRADDSVAASMAAMREVKRMGLGDMYIRELPPYPCSMNDVYCVVEEWAY